jgi:predicted GNAT family acetyltransferase
MEIEHLTDRTQFVARLDEGRAILDYEVLADGAWDLTHTYVPTVHRNRGIGAALVRRALDQAKEEGRKVVPSCPFVASFIDEHPGYRELLR